MFAALNASDSILNITSPYGIYITAGQLGRAPSIYLENALNDGSIYYNSGYSGSTTKGHIFREWNYTTGTIQNLAKLDSTGLDLITFTGGGTPIFKINGTQINSAAKINTWSARNNFTDTVDFNGSTVINFPTLDALNVSSSGTLYDAIIDNSLSLGIAFDGSAPATNLGGGAPGSYYGSSGANYLGDPAKWMIITLNGNLYRIPLYTP
jgi:hypothetical protein